MPFSHDIVLSYAHIDNQPVEGSEGWVTSLHKHLTPRLNQLLGRKAKIWWDDRQQDNQYLAGMIGDEISDTLLLTTILSPTYANSEWCRGELTEFCSRADQTGGIYQNGVARIFCVVKTPDENVKIPKQLASLKRLEFYEVDANGKVREFKPTTGEHRDQKYWDKFEDLVYLIKRAIEKLDPRAHAEPNPAELPLAKKVYLAETSTDMREARDRVMRELLEQGYHVLPNVQLPLSVPAFQDAVRDQLSRCALAIHIIGEGYGVIPDGEEEERSIVRLQLELASERADADPSFTQLAWMPVGLQAKATRQQLFIEELNKNLRAELLQTTVEDLKSRILEKLRSEPSRSSADIESRGPKRVYLICDNRDLNDVVEIEDYLFTQGYEVIPSINEGDSDQVAQYHRENLIGCDAALIYYGQANQLWLRLKMWDLIKASGWGRKKPMLSQTVYVSGPKTREKERFRTHEAIVIHNFERFKPDILQPFISALNSGNGGRQ